MKRSKLKEIMMQYGIVESELMSVCDFVSELLHQRALEIEKEEPYATNTIAEYEDAAYKAFELMDYIEEILEGEDE